MGSEGYISKYSLSVNCFSFLNLHKCFWILLVYLCVGSSSINLAFPSCSSSFLIASPSDKTGNPEHLSNG